MAKSMRSKWKRKMRSEKRAKNNVRDRARNERLVKKGIENMAKQGVLLQEDGTVKHVTSSLKPLSAGTIAGDSGATMTGVESEPMEATESIKRNKQLQDEHGNYPVWYNQRKMKKVKQMAKNKKKSKAAKRELKKSKF